MQLGQSMNKRNKKTKKPLMPLLKSQEWVWKAKVGYGACPWGQHDDRSGQRTRALLPAQLLNMPLPSPLHVRNKLTHASGSKQKGACYSFSLPFAAAGAPIKPCWKNNDALHLTDCIQIDYVLCCQRWRSSIQSGKTRLGADCGSDHELLIAKTFNE